MSAGPACERCGTNSYEGSSDRSPSICPWCGKPKRRGSRDELVKILCEARHTMYAAVGYIHDQSIATKDGITKRLVECIKAIEDS